MSIREFVKSCAKKAKNFVIRCWKKAKSFLMEHSDTIAPICSIAIGASLFVVGFVFGDVTRKINNCEAASDNVVPATNTSKDLPKPDDWGDEYDIQEHWIAADYGAGCERRAMILDTELWHLGDLGEKLINDNKCNANPDLGVSLILGYGVG